MIRDAVPRDADALTELEARCFPLGRRMSWRSFARLVRRPTAAMLVEEARGSLRGYALVLFRKDTTNARLYSICTAPEARGQGIARKLLSACETQAAARGATRMRLEVHAGDKLAQKLYTEAGYVRFGTYPHYYEDGASALRMEKKLR